jgi:hypothetical protein
LSVLDISGQEKEKKRKIKRKRKIKQNTQDPKKRAPFLKTPEKQGSGVINWITIH